MTHYFRSNSDSMLLNMLLRWKVGIWFSNLTLNPTKHSQVLATDMHCKPDFEEMCVSAKFQAVFLVNTLFRFFSGKYTSTIMLRLRYVRRTEESNLFRIVFDGFCETLQLPMSWIKLLEGRVLPGVFYKKFIYFPD